MELSNYKHIVFLGIGGIGMSAIARYCRHGVGCNVQGYDKTPSELTLQLQQEGIPVVFTDALSALNAAADIHAGNTLVVFTPAIPADSTLLLHFRNHGFRILKRAEILGLITRNTYNLSVAGTHGKTTTTAMLQHLLLTAATPHVAFLGGISASLNSNYFNNLRPETVRPISITEADEYDRSFLQLNPDQAIITAIDPDHLDIYGEAAEVDNAFALFATKLKTGGILLLQERLRNRITIQDGPIYTYGIGRGDFRAESVEIREGRYHFVLHAPDLPPISLRSAMPGKHNVENATGAAAMYLLAGGKPEQLAAGLESFRGVKRRFEYIFHQPFPFIDDYAHHPEELSAFLSAVREMYPGKTITGIFQPHLYSRTRDFATQFAHSLELLDRLILLDIYPARELPMEGVDSSIIARHVARIPCSILSWEEALSRLKKEIPEVLVTIGAGDIDRLVPQIKSLFE